MSAPRPVLPHCPVCHTPWPADRHLQVDHLFAAHRARTFGLLVRLAVRRIVRRLRAGGRR